MSRLQFPLRSLFPATAVVAVMLLALRLCGLSEAVAARLAAVAIGFLLAWVVVSAAGGLAAGWFSRGGDENRKQLQTQENFENAALVLSAVLCLFGALQLAAWLWLILYVATPQTRGPWWLIRRPSSFRYRRRLTLVLAVGIMATLGGFAWLLNDDLHYLGEIVPQASEEVEAWQMRSMPAVIRNVAYHNAGSLALLSISLLAASRSLTCHEDQAAEHRYVVASSQLAAILLTAWQSVWVLLVVFDIVSPPPPGYSYLAEAFAGVGLWSLWCFVLVLTPIVITWTLMGLGTFIMWRDHAWMFLLGLLAVVNAAIIYLYPVAMFMRSSNMG